MLYKSTIIIIIIIIIVSETVDYSTLASYQYTSERF